MDALPVIIESKRELPDYLPARMVNEFTYCPRLFFYEWVEGLFAESVDTIEGAIQHKRVDAKASALPAEAQDSGIHARSVTLSSERLHVIAKMDLVELSGRTATPVDYKRGSPREGADGELELWPTDRAQLAVQAIVLRENGYQCDAGVAYYKKTQQRVRIGFDDAVIAKTEDLIREAWKTAEEGLIPPPLDESPKCAGCSLAGICLPDETRVSGFEEAVEDPRQLGAVRWRSSKAGEARGAGVDDATERTETALSEYPGRTGGQKRCSPAGEGKREGGAGGADRRDLPGEPHGERTDLDAGGAGVVHERCACLLLLDGRVVFTGSQRG
jgi:CRISPR-associated protein Cas4